LFKKKWCETEVKVTDDELKSFNLQKDEFHGEWNYKISPQTNIK